MNSNLSSPTSNYIQNTQQCQEHACMSVDDWKHRNYKSFQIGRRVQKHIEKMFKPNFKSDNVSWIGPYTHGPSNVLWYSTSLQIKKRIVIDMYLFLSLKEV